MTGKVVRIGGASAFVTDSTIGMAQFLAMKEPPHYLLFDMLSEGIMPHLGRASVAGQPGFSQTFPGLFVLPHLRDLLARGIRLVANAGGVDGAACAEAIRKGAAAQGLEPVIAVIDGDDLRGQAERLLARDPVEIDSGAPLRAMVGDPSRLLSMSAYVGAFPIARALALGADIVILGRAVDSAAALGPLIHEFGWGPDDFDKLAGGTLAGHLIECSAQATGGTFTDWETVGGWDEIGYPIAECGEDGSFVLTKPPGTGGLVSPATCAEQLIYEVGDPQAYVVPDVVCDFSGVRLEPAGPDRVRVSGARGRGRPGCYKVSLTVDDGWQASAVIPVIGRDARAKAMKMGAALIERTRGQLRRRNLAEWRASHVEPLGAEAAYGPYASKAALEVREVLCRIVCEHESREGAELLVREQQSLISHMAPGTSITLASGIKPLNRIGAFLLDKAEVPLTLHVAGRSEGVSLDCSHVAALVASPPPPHAPEDLDGGTVPLVALALARSGDKGDLFNVGVIARKPEYLPAIHAALGDEAVLAHYRHLASEPAGVRLERYFAPGFDCINFVIHGCMQGGIQRCLMYDGGAKGMAQLLLDHPVAIPGALRHDPDLARWLGPAG